MFDLFKTIGHGVTPEIFSVRTSLIQKNNNKRMKSQVKDHFGSRCCGTRQLKMKEETAVFQIQISIIFLFLLCFLVSIEEFRVFLNEYLYLQEHGGDGLERWLKQNNC